MKSVALFFFGYLMFAFGAFAQDVNVLLKEAESFEFKLKEVEALDKYKQVLVQDANNFKALVKCAELSAAIGARLPAKKDKQLYFESTLAFAERAIKAQENNADGYYVAALVHGKLTDVETENKKIVAHVKDVRALADKALSINPNHARANYILGKWNMEMLNLSGIKKAAVKLLYGGLPDASIEAAITAFEKCRTADPYFILNYIDLGKAYIQNNQPTKAIEVLQKATKLPLRTADDAALKEEAKKILLDLE
jgi:tetratricopeptide (TPR) repeat protein